jgi:uncharacterized protein affecting Mg2+/Co2+ transport
VQDFETWRYQLNNVNAGKSNNYLIGEYWIITMCLMAEVMKHLLKKKY